MGAQEDADQQELEAEAHSSRVVTLEKRIRGVSRHYGKRLLGARITLIERDQIALEFFVKGFFRRRWYREDVLAFWGDIPKAKLWMKSLEEAWDKRYEVEKNGVDGRIVVGTLLSDGEKPKGGELYLLGRDLGDADIAGYAGKEKVP